MSRGPVTEITLDSLEALAIGAGILGTGGGGSPYLGKVRCRVLMTELGVTIPAHQVGDIDDEAVVSSVGGIGAPTVGIERPGEGTELAKGVRVLEQYTGKQATHMISAEIGGGNAIAPLIAAIQLGLPVVDGDGMGRAFPELQMDTYMIYGLKPTPNVLTGTHGHSVIFDHITEAKDLERYARAIAHYRASEIDIALDLLGELLAETPEDPWFLELEGQILFETGRTGDAIGPYRQANAIVDDSALLKLGLARALIESDEEPDEAIELLREATVIEPRNPTFWRFLGVALGRNGEEGEASLAFAEHAVLSGNREDADLYLSRARKHVSQGDPGWVHLLDLERAASEI